MFPVREMHGSKKLREEMLATCQGFIELVETVCEEDRGWRPPVSYTIVGEVAIVSLGRGIKGREREVAEDILKHVKNIRAVYGKEETSGEYRVQRLVHLAGDRVDETIYKEHGLVYRIPLGRVYVNPRLSTEHYRIASQVAPGEYVLDMFAGIGGFSLLISSLGRAAIVVANDSNPWAVETMLHAIWMNRRRLKSPILVLGMDARRLPDMLMPVFNRIIMNLPHGSLGFLDVAKRLCSPRGCVIHVYVVAQSSREALGMVPGAVNAVRVLDYAPRKFIYRVDVLAKGSSDE